MRPWLSQASHRAPGPWDKCLETVTLHCWETPLPWGLLTTELTHSLAHVQCREALPAVPCWLSLGRLRHSHLLSARRRQLTLPCGTHSQSYDCCQKFLEGEACILRF